LLTENNSFSKQQIVVKRELETIINFKRETSSNQANTHKTSPSKNEVNRGEEEEESCSIKAIIRKTLTNVKIDFFSVPLAGSVLSKWNLSFCYKSPKKR